MIIAVYKPKDLPISINIYIENVIANTNTDEISFVYFNSPTRIPKECSVIWDPQVAGGYPPAINKSHTDKKIVITIHGLALFSIKLSEQTKSKFKATRLLYERQIIKHLWRKYKNDYHKIITVSEYSRNEIVKHLGFSTEKVNTIYHGVDNKRFTPGYSSSKDYFLHISSYQAKKNIERLVKAYTKVVSNEEVLPLVIISNNCPIKSNNPKLIIINKKVSSDEIARYMKSAYGFMFPSLHETFGMPLVEAMSSGVPVVTSNSTSCREIVDNNGLLINPRSIQEISESFLELSFNKKLRDKFVGKGLDRAKDFSWVKCANEHVKIFKNIIE